VRIARIETVRLQEHRHTLWVRVHTDGGLVGLGETFYVPGAVAAFIHEVAAPMLLGAVPLEIERHWHGLYHAVNYYATSGAELRAISALDIALWDIAGQVAGQPIYQLLGGQVRDRVRTYNTCVSYGAINDFAAFHERADRLAEDLLSEGITAMKVWPFDQFASSSAPGPARSSASYAVGQHISAEQIKRGLRTVQMIRDAVGDRMEVAIEMHSRWNLPSAIRIARALEPYDIFWLEDAITPEPVDDLARLVQETRVPICVSERLCSRYAFRQVLERRAAHVIMPDIIWSGGISEGRKIATMAEAYHLPIAPHDCSGPVNVFACLHLCASAPNTLVMESVRAYYRGYYDDLVEPNMEVRDGHIAIPAGPGLGTRLRPAVLERSDALVEVSG
jgi:galactonate dehydratase